MSQAVVGMDRDMYSVVPMSNSYGVNVPHCLISRFAIVKLVILAKTNPELNSEQRILTLW